MGEQMREQFETAMLAAGWHALDFDRGPSGEYNKLPARMASDAWKAAQSVAAPQVAAEAVPMSVVAREAAGGVISTFAELLREALDPLEVSAALIESDDTDHMERLLRDIRAALEAYDRIRATPQPSPPALAPQQAEEVCGEYCARHLGLKCRRCRIGAAHPRGAVSGRPPK